MFHKIGPQLSWQCVIRDKVVNSSEITALGYLENYACNSHYVFYTLDAHCVWNIVQMLCLYMKRSDATCKQVVCACLRIYSACYHKRRRWYYDFEFHTKNRFSHILPTTAKSLNIDRVRLTHSNICSCHRMTYFVTKKSFQEFMTI